MALAERVGPAREEFYFPLHRIVIEAVLLREDDQYMIMRADAFNRRVRMHEYHRLRNS